MLVIETGTDVVNVNTTLPAYFGRSTEGGVLTRYGALFDHKGYAQTTRFPSIILLMNILLVSPTHVQIAGITLPSLPVSD